MQSPSHICLCSHRSATKLSKNQEVWNSLRIANLKLRDILVGAVGIENTENCNFKDLRGSTRGPKVVKKHARACTGIRIAPLKRPRSLELWQQEIIDGTRMANFDGSLFPTSVQASTIWQDAPGPLTRNKSPLRSNLQGWNLVHAAHYSAAPSLMHPGDDCYTAVPSENCYKLRHLAGSMWLVDILSYTVVYTTVWYS